MSYELWVVILWVVQSPALDEEQKRNNLGLLNTFHARIYLKMPPNHLLRIQSYLSYKWEQYIKSYASTIDEILNDGFSEEKEADSDVDDDI